MLGRYIEDAIRERIPSGGVQEERVFCCCPHSVEYYPPPRGEMAPHSPSLPEKHENMALLSCLVLTGEHAAMGTSKCKGC